jgi:hypothetical protein
LNVPSQFQLTRDTGSELRFDPFSVTSLRARWRQGELYSALISPGGPTTMSDFHDLVDLVVADVGDVVLRQAIWPHRLQT